MYLIACDLPDLKETTKDTVQCEKNLQTDLTTPVHLLDLSAILIPQLVEEDFLTSAKSSEASWIASLSNLGQLAGSLATGVVSNTYGRKARKHMRIL